MGDGRFKPGNKGGGRPKKTDEERAGYDFLAERTVFAATKLFALQASADEKIALAAVTAHLKIVLGDLQREAGKDGESASLVGWTPEQVMAALDKIEAMK